MTTDKKYIIDPFNCVCKIALLYFYPNKTRLSISNHVLHIQEYMYYQGIQRMLNGDTRTDISNLDSPIYKFLKWYIIDGPEKFIMEEKVQNYMHTIVKFAIMGLEKLQNNLYIDDKTVNIVLQYLITMMKLAINNKWDEDQMIKSTYNNVLSEKIRQNIDSGVIESVYNNLIDADKLLVKIKTDNLIPNDSDNINLKNISENINILITCVHDILKLRDNIFVDQMKQIITTL